MNPLRPSLRRLRPPLALPAGLAAAFVAGIALVAASPAPPASAHPFGDPQTIELTAGETPGEVAVRWRVGGADDLTLLGVALGVLPRSRVLLDGAVLVEEGDAPAVAVSPELADYLDARVQVSSAGRPCAGAVADPAADPAGAGIEMVFTCPGDTHAVDLTARLLTDLHPAYTTLASGPGGQRAVYDVEHRRARWQLTSEGAPGAERAAGAGLGRSAALQIGSVLAGAGALAGAGLVWARRRPRS